MPGTEKRVCRVFRAKIAARFMRMRFLWAYRAFWNTNGTRS